MKIQIQAYWNTEVKTINFDTKLTIEKVIEECGSIRICCIIIDDHIRGSIDYNGKELIFVPGVTP